MKRKKEEITMDDVINFLKKERDIVYKTFGGVSPYAKGNNETKTATEAFILDQDDQAVSLYRQELLEKIEGKKLTDDGKDMLGFEVGYNKALSDIESLLKEK